jgi:hypothetical protein
MTGSPAMLRKRTGGASIVDGEKRVIMQNGDILLVRWNRNQRTALSGGNSATFRYDAVGCRRGQTIGGSTTNFLNDGLNFVQELASGRAPTASLLTGLGIDQSPSRTDNGGTVKPLTDHLGAVSQH